MYLPYLIRIQHDSTVLTKHIEAQNGACSLSLRQCVLPISHHVSHFVPSFLLLLIAAYHSLSLHHTSDPKWAKHQSPATPKSKTQPEQRWRHRVSKVINATFNSPSLFWAGQRITSNYHWLAVKRVLWGSARWICLARACLNAAFTSFKMFHESVRHHARAFTGSKAEI
jgi:hypothetical protein